jgi:N-acetyl-gamma-glutamyl-phosphate reductase
MKRVSVVGATGYSGGELCAILARHPSVTLAGAFSSSGGARAPFSTLHASLRGVAGPDVVPYAREALAAGAPDVVFLATPNETSAGIASGILSTGAAVIDLSGAFRLRSAEEYPAWYGFAHPAPELLARAVYGLPEWQNGALSGARLVANPGCYPTSVLLALKPLVSLLDPAQPVVCDAASGVSGAGKRSEAAYSFSEISGNCKVYGVGTHRHEPEMRQELGLVEGTAFVFVPHLLPTVRGILATIHVGFSSAQTEGTLERIFSSAYASAPFVDVLPAGELPELKDVVGTPRAAIGFVLLAGGKRAVVVCAIDNLLKGAASTAVQNMNRLLGFPETEGLS